MQDNILPMLTLFYLPQFRRTALARDLFIVESYKRAPAARNVFFLSGVRAENTSNVRIEDTLLSKFAQNVHNLC